MSLSERFSTRLKKLSNFGVSAEKPSLLCPEHLDRSYQLISDPNAILLTARFAANSPLALSSPLASGESTKVLVASISLGIDPCERIVTLE